MTVVEIIGAWSAFSYLMLFVVIRNWPKSIEIVESNAAIIFILAPFTFIIAAGMIVCNLCGENFFSRLLLGKNHNEKR